MTLDASIKIPIACAIVALVIWLDKCRRQSSYPLPPGPKKLPVVGNLFDMPKGRPWIKYHEWCKEYGTDILHLEAAGTSMIVLDSLEAATDLLDKRSASYSGRTPQTMVREVMGWDFVVGRMPYGERWRRGRRYIHNAFHPKVALRFQPQQLKAAHNLLRRLLDPSVNLMVALRQMAGENIMRVAYGIDVLEKNDPYIALAERAMRSFTAASLPGAFLVDYFPWLKHFPSWMPGAGPKKLKEWRADARSMVNAPFAEMKRQLNSPGTSRSSFAADAIMNLEANSDLQEAQFIKDSAATLYVAGVDTTLSALSSCFLGLLENPGIVAKAQRQIDEITCSKRLPNFDDFDRLPYVTAITKEALRWRDAAPLGIPHFTAQEDEYRGHYIPAKSMVIANQWAMLHDPIAYPEPFKFNPERFLDKDGKIDPTVRDPATIAFGFGRRICPGRHMAFSSMWIALANILAVYDVTKKADEYGNIIPLTHEYIWASMILPHPYECSIKLRSKDAEELIRATVSERYD